MLLLPENAQADLPVAIEVGIETYSSGTCRHEFYSGGIERIRGGETDRKVEETSFVWSVKGTCDESMELKRKERH